MKQETYEELTELHGCDWFNTNPIHVLRSQYSIDDNVEPLVYYEIGKQYQLGYGIWEEMASRVESDVHSKLLMAPTWVAGTREDVEESNGGPAHSSNPSPAAQDAQLARTLIASPANAP